MARRLHVICASAALAEAGPGVRFTLASEGGEESGFVVRHCGAVRAYVNRCPHMGTELDWQPGEFFEQAGIYLICSTHGALFEPATGHCVAGPCRGLALDRIEVIEEGGAVLLPEGPPAPQRRPDGA